MTSPGSSAASEVDRLMQSGRPQEALIHAQRAVENTHLCLPEHGLLASLLLKLGRIQDADQVIVQAMALATGSGDAYDGLAFVSIALGRHERANELYRRAAGVAPREPRFWYNLACSERSLGEPAKVSHSVELTYQHHSEMGGKRKKTFFSPIIQYEVLARPDGFAWARLLLLVLLAVAA